MILRALLSSYLHRTSLKGFTSGIVRIVFVWIQMLRWNLPSSFMRFSLFTVPLGSVRAVPFPPFCLATLFTILICKSDPNNSSVKLDLILQV